MLQDTLKKPEIESDPVGTICLSNAQSSFPEISPRFQTQTLHAQGSVETCQKPYKTLQNHTLATELENLINQDAHAPYEALTGVQSQTKWKEADACNRLPGANNAKTSLP